MTNNQNTNRTTTPTVVYTLNGTDCTASLPFTVTRRKADTNTDAVQSVAYISVATGYDYMEKTAISFEPLIQLLANHSVKRMQLILTPYYVSLNSKGECPIRFSHPTQFDSETFYCKVDEELAINLKYRDEFLDDASFFTLETTSADEIYSAQFYASGEHAPRIELEYYIDEDHERSFASLPSPSGMAAELDVRTGEAELSFGDGVVSASPLGISLSHVLCDGMDANHYGAGFGLSLDEKLRGGDENADYIYTDPTGTKHGFYEYFYYMNGNVRVDVDKASVETDSEGNLFYNDFKVTRELRSSTGWEASAKLEGVKKIPLLEQRTEEEAKLEEQMESYKKALCDYVKVNKENGEICKNEEGQEIRIKDPTWENYTSFASEDGRILMPFSDAVAFHSLWLQMNLLYAQVDSYDLQDYSLEFQKNSLELQARNCALQLNSLDEQYATNEKDADFAANQEKYHDRMQGYSGYKYDGFTSLNLDQIDIPVAEEIVDESGNVDENPYYFEPDQEWIDKLNACFSGIQASYYSDREATLLKLNKISGNQTNKDGMDDDSMYKVIEEQKKLAEDQITLIEDASTDFKDINKTQKAFTNSQKKLCERQLTEIRSKAEEYLETFRKLLVAYLQMKEKLDALREQMPVAYMKKDGIIKGFNRDGYLVAIFDSYENIIAIERDESHRITRVYDDKGNEATFNYTNDRLSELSDVYGNRVSYTYNANGYLTTVTFGGGARLVLEYHENSNIKTVTATGGNSDESKVSFMYNGDGKLETVTHASLKTQISHGSTTAGETVISSLAIAYGLKETTVTDAENETVAVYRFDSRENLSEYYLTEKGLVAEAKKLVRDYTSANRNETVYTALGSALYSKSLESFSFDDLSSNFRKETVAYNDFRQPTSKTVLEVSPMPSTLTNSTHNEAKEYVTSYTYDAKRRLIKESTTENRAAYWPDAQILQGSELLRTTVTEYVYDALDRLVRRESYLLGKELSEGKTVEETVYDENGKVKESYTYNSLDPASKLYTVTEKDESGRTIAEYDATGRYKTTLSYAPDGSLRTELFPNGAAVSYGTSPDGRSTSVTASTEEGEENTNVTHYTAGVVTKLESGGNTVEYTYDGKRRVTAVSLNGQPYASYTHDEDWAGGLGKSSTVTYANGDHFEKRELAGNWTDTYYNSNTILSEQYADDGRILTRDSEAYTYDADGKLLSVAANNQFAQVTAESYTYDSEGRVVGYSVTPAGKTDATGYNYTYDSVTGKLLSTAVDAITVTPKLDKLGRNAGKTVNVSGARIAEEKISYLKFGDRATNLPVTLSFESVGKTDTLSYIYDRMGNICEIRENGRIKARYAYDALGRLIREDNRDFAKTEVFAYDNKGNILSKRVYPFSLENMDKVEALALADEKHYSYNGDRLVSYNGETFLYDVLGNPVMYRGKVLSWYRARLLTNFGGISFTYDALGRCTQMGESTIAYDHNGNIVEANGLRVLRDHSGVFAVKHNDSTYFCKKNAQNDVIALLDNTGAVVVKYSYDAWGKCKVLNPNGTENTEPSFIGNINPFRYRSYYYDVNTGLYYLKSRFYDPETGRFLNADSIDYLEPNTVNGLNLYAYCFNTPVNCVDPTGNAPWWSWLISGLQLVGGIALCFVPGAQAVGVSMIIGGSLGLIANAASPAIAQAIGGASSMATGWGAISTGASLLSLGLPGIIAGGALMLVGGLTMAFGVNEIVASATGTNYIQQWTGMSDSAYRWTYFGLNVASSIGTMAANAYLTYVRINTLKGLESANYGPKASKHIGDRSYYDSILTQREIVKYGKIYKAKYGVQGFEFRINGSYVMGNSIRQSITSAGLSSAHNTGVWSLVYGKGTIWHFLIN